MHMADVYLSLNGIVIPNNGYVILDLMMTLLFSVIPTDFRLLVKLILEETGMIQMELEYKIFMFQGSPETEVLW